MPSEYTPTMEQARAVWCAFSEYGGLVDRPHSGLWDDRLAEFDRAIATHDEQVRAAAWDEGFHAAYRYVGKCEDAAAAGQGVMIPDPVNPYRAVPAEQKESN